MFIFTKYVWFTFPCSPQAILEAKLPFHPLYHFCCCVNDIFDIFSIFNIFIVIQVVICDREEPSVLLWFAPSRQCMKARVKTRSENFHCRYHLESTQEDHLSGLATEGQLSVFRIFHHEFLFFRLSTELPTRLAKVSLLRSCLSTTTSSSWYIFFNRTVQPCNVNLASIIWQAIAMSWLSSAVMRMGRMLCAYGGSVPLFLSGCFPVVRLFLLNKFFH